MHVPFNQYSKGEKPSLYMGNADSKPKCVMTSKLISTGKLKPELLDIY